MSSDARETPSGDALRFDTAVPPAEAAPTSCAACRAAIRAEYYEVQGSVVCPSCKDALVSSAGSRTGRAGRAVILGAGAAIAGAALYLAITVATHIEFGLIGIVVGYMVGAAVRAGTRNRGGRTYQLLAAVLTYFAISITHTAEYIGRKLEEKQQPAATSAGAPASDHAPADTATLAYTAVDSAGAPTAPSAATTGPATAASTAGDTTSRHENHERHGVASVGVILLGAAVLLTIAPIATGFADFPSNIIGLLILAFAVFQAWRMNAALVLRVSGPYRVSGAAPEAPRGEAGA
jgi:hypothetical protein